MPVDVLMPPDASDAQVPPVPPLSPVPPVRALRRPTARLLFSHPAHAIALGFGSGLSPVAPGTVGTLWAWIAFLVVQPRVSTPCMGALIAGSFLIGWWACTVTARTLYTPDPSAIVWDEVLGFWLVLWLVTPAGLAAQAVAFALYRYFDIAKPGPVAWADQRVKAGQRGARVGWAHGFAILLDDLVAALCTLLAIALWHRLLP